MKKATSRCGIWKGVRHSSRRNCVGSRACDEGMREGAADGVVVQTGHICLPAASSALPPFSAGSRLPPLQWSPPVPPTRNDLSSGHLRAASSRQRPLQWSLPAVRRPRATSPVVSAGGDRSGSDLSSGRFWCHPLKTTSEEVAPGSPPPIVTSRVVASGMRARERPLERSSPAVVSARDLSSGQRRG